MKVVSDVLASATQLVEALNELLTMADTMRREIGDLKDIRRRIQLIHKGFYGLELEVDSEGAEEETPGPVPVNPDVENVEPDLAVDLPSTAAIQVNEQQEVEGQSASEEEPLVLFFGGDEPFLESEI
ncbi:MAG: hypothetical protein QXT16_08275 [Candidatus Caldarchaeum sp.]